MNAVEIEQAISDLALAPFDRDEFPYAFLQAFGNKATTIRRLRSGTSNKSNLDGVLQTNNIHIAVALPGEVTKMLTALKASPATIRYKAKFILATDGITFEAEELESGETIACAYTDFPNHFGFFLALAGITTVKQVRDSSFDIRATSRLNKLYIELLKDNPDWGTAEHRELIHKIGVTGGKVETRIAGATHDATYLLADVEILATWKLAGINRTRLEALFHRIFASAQLDLTIQDRFGHPVRPREWFLVPLSIIDEVVERILDGSISDVIYDPKTANLQEI